LDELRQVLGSGEETAVRMGMIGYPSDRKTGGEQVKDFQKFGGGIAFMENEGKILGFQILTQFDQGSFELGRVLDVFRYIEVVKVAIDRLVAEGGEFLALIISHYFLN